MSSDPKRLEELIPFNEVTTEKTVPGTDLPQTPVTEVTAEKTYPGADLPPGTPNGALPDYQAETPPLPADNELNPVVDLLTPSPIQPVTTFPALHESQENIPVNENPEPPVYHATDELTGEISAPQKPKKDWKAIFEMARVRAKDLGSVARDKAGDLIMKFQLLPPKQKKIAYTGAGVFAGVFTLALFLPRHRPAPHAHRPPRPHARPPVGEPPPVRQSQGLPVAPPEPPRDVALPAASSPPTVVQKAAPVPAPKKVAEKKAVEKKTSAKKTDAKKADAKKSTKTVAKKDAKKKDKGKKKAVAKKDAKKGKSTKQAATKKKTNRKPASQQE